MSTPYSLQEIPVPETAITDVDMARDMAYFELPYLKLGKTAAELGLNNDASRNKELAVQAGIIAGRSYLKEHSVSLDEKTHTNLTERLEAGLLETPEQRRRARHIIFALSEKFDRPKEDFGLIRVTEKDMSGNERTVVKAILTATNGIDLGDPDKKFDKRRRWDYVAKEGGYAYDKFGIWPGGKRADVRDGLNVETLKVLAQVNPDIFESVWLVGVGGVEDSSGYKPIANIQYGGVSCTSGWHKADNDHFAFRPVVTIPKI